MEAAPRVFPPWLLPVGGLVVLCCPSLHVTLHVWICHEVDVAITVTFETHQHHTWQDRKGQYPVVTLSSHTKHAVRSRALTFKAFKRFYKLYLWRDASGKQILLSAVPFRGHHLSPSNPVVPCSLLLHPLTQRWAN